MADAVLTLEAQFIDHITSSLRSVTSNMERMELQIHESTGQITKDIAKLNEENKKTPDGFGKAAAAVKNWVVGIGAAYVGGRAFFNLIGDSISEAREAAQTQRDLATSIELSGRGAAMSVESMYAFAGSLAAVTDFQDDAIAGAASLLLQFDHLGNESIPRVTELAVDLSKKFGTDLSSATTLLGRALQDPTAGLNLLNRQYRIFSDTEEDGIKKMVESGHGLEAQERIIAKLEERFKGFAKSTVDPIKQSQVAFAEAKEEIGNQLMPTLASFTNYLSKEVIPFWMNFGSETKKRTAETRELREEMERMAKRKGPGNFAGDQDMAEARKNIDERKKYLAEANKMAEEERIRREGTPVPKAEEKAKDFGGLTTDQRAKIAEDRQKAAEEEEHFQLQAEINAEKRNAKYEEAVRKRADFEYEIKAENEKKLAELDKKRIESEQKKMDISLQTAMAMTRAFSIIAGKSKVLFAVEKAIALAEVAVATARNITQQPGPYGTLIPFWAALGVSQGAVITAEAVKGFAHGTIAAPGGGAIVGENGPEYIPNLPRGSRVFNNTETRNMFGGSPINANFSVVINGNANSGTVDQIRQAGDDYIQKLRELKRMNRDLTYMNVPEN